MWAPPPPTVSRRQDIKNLATSSHDRPGNLLTIANNGPCSCRGGLYRVNHMKKVFRKKKKRGGRFQKWNAWFDPDFQHFTFWNGPPEKLHFIMWPPSTTEQKTRSSFFASRTKQKSPLWHILHLCLKMSQLPRCRMCQGMRSLGRITYLERTYSAFLLAEWTSFNIWFYLHRMSPSIT